MRLPRAGCTIAVLTPLAAIALLAVVTWTPPTHPINTPGARGLIAEFAPGRVAARGGVPAPTTSLTTLRCAVWHTLNFQPCPDDASLALRMWPTVVAGPARLYVAMSSDRQPVTGPYGFNVEFGPSSRTLMINEYFAQPLFVRPRPLDETAGAGLAPALTLLVINTDSIAGGQISVEDDRWIERITGAERDGESVLGTVVIDQGANMPQSDAARESASTPGWVRK